MNSVSYNVYKTIGVLCNYQVIIVDNFAFCSDPLLIFLTVIPR